MDLLVTGKTIEVRDLAEKVLSKVVLTLFDKLDREEAMLDRGQVEEVIERLTKELLALMPLEVSKYWHKVGPYLNFFNKMVQDGNIRRVSYFVRSGLVTRLVELISRFNSQVEYSVPPFDKLVETVSILARCQPLVIYLYGIPDQF